MFSDKVSVNRLTASMLAYDVCHVVVCPGSRNAPLVHNFFALVSEGKMRVWPVTDERSAAFVAIGIYLATRQPAAVCVTSGSALLNTLPAVAEAYYRHAPLLVISADRPSQDVGQLKGQTIPQQGALQPYTSTWQLPETDETTSCALCDEALHALHKGGGRPVHINVPLSEPLHIYNNTKSLPSHSPTIPTSHTDYIPSEVINLLKEADLPAIFVGQMDFPPKDLLHEIDRRRNFLVLSEAIGSSVTHTMHGYHWELSDNTDFLPDVIVHIGGTGIDKDYAWLVRHKNAAVIRIEEHETATPDTFGRLRTVVRTDTEAALRQLLSLLPPKSSVQRFHSMLDASCSSADNSTLSDEADRSHIPTKWERQIIALLDEVRQQDAIIHIGNSSVLRYFRLGHLAPPHLLCNRGVNGIDGSLSVAAGHSLATDKNVYCILGDLSFFYDSNALWNERLRGNLRILLLNDQGGDIFNRVQGLKDTSALSLISGKHHATAEGICSSYDIDYIGLDYTSRQDDSSHHEAFPQKVLEQLTAPPEVRKRPLVVECFEPSRPK